MRWKEVKTGHKFNDGSQVTQIHDTVQENCFEIITNEGKITLSEHHYLLCNVKRTNKKLVEALLLYAPKKLPKEGNIHFYKGTNGYKIEEEVTAWDDIWFDKKKNLLWLDVQTIHYLYKVKQNIKLVKYHDKKYQDVKILDINWAKIKKCFCVSTDTGQYSLCGLVHHNSVTLRNVLFHSITHSDDIKLALVDFKLSEFARYKTMDKKRVVGVANNVQATAKLLRMGREIMYKRNQQNSDRDLTNFADFEPQGPTDIIRIFGREFNENDMFDVEIHGEKKQMAAKDILDWVNSH